MFNLLFIIIQYVLANDIILVEKDPIEFNLNNVCPTNCKKSVYASEENLPRLIRMLEEKGIDEAAVAGYNQVPGNFVVNKDGKVRCYGSDSSQIQYVFCYADWKPPCSGVIRRVPLIPYDRKPYPCPPNPCPPYPCRPHPCPPYPCRPYPCYPKYPSHCRKPWKSFPCHNPYRPSCPEIRINKCCIDRCGRVRSQIQGNLRCYRPAQCGPYLYDE